VPKRRKIGPRPARLPCKKFPEKSRAGAVDSVTDPVYIYSSVFDPASAAGSLARGEQRELADRPGDDAMNLLIGDRIEFRLPQFSGGSFFQGRARGAKYTGDKDFAGVIERESYGRASGQHTFSIRLDDGTLKRVKGRNLYDAILTHAPAADHEAQAAAKQARIARATDSIDCDARVPARLR
jgi:hypothetical protein